MKRIYLYLLLVATLTIGCKKDSQNGPEGESSQKVTVMFYSVGGGNLDYRQTTKMRYMVHLGCTDNFQMTAQYKLSKQYQDDPQYQQYAGVLRLDAADAKSMKGCEMPTGNEDILASLKGLPFTKLSDDPQMDMCNAKALMDFINWSAERHPADKYILILADHGGGWKIGTDGGALPKAQEGGSAPARSIVFDDNIDNKSLSGKAIAEAIAQSSVQRVHIVHFDACLMGTWETAFEMQSVSDYMVAANECSYGSNYVLLLNDLINNVNSPYEGYKKYIDEYVARTNAEKTYKYFVDLGIYDLKQCANMVPVFKKMVTCFQDLNTTAHDTYFTWVTASLRTSYVACGGSVWVLPQVLEKILSCYPETQSTISKDQKFYLLKEVEPVLLLRKNHPQVWETLTADQIVTTLENVGNSALGGMTMASFANELVTLNDAETAEEKAAQKRLQDLGKEYLDNLRMMSYVRCSHGTAEDALIQTSLSINVMALNEEGWKPLTEKWGEFNQQPMARQYSWEEAAKAYTASAFSQQTSWGDFLKICPMNLNLSSNKIRSVEGIAD